MGQARACRGDGAIMNVFFCFEVHPRSGDPTVRWRLFLGIVCQAGPRLARRSRRVVNFGGEPLKVVEPLRVNSPMEIVAAT